MKRKKTQQQQTPSIDRLLSLSPTLEALDCSTNDILAARDFSGIPYHIYTTVSTVRFDFELLQHMINTRGKQPGRRSFLGPDGRLLALDIFQCQEPHVILTPCVKRPTGSLTGNRHLEAPGIQLLDANTQYISRPDDATRSTSHHCVQ